MYKENDRESKYEIKEDEDDPEKGFNITVKSKTIKNEQKWNTIDEDTKVKFKKPSKIANKKSRIV